MSERIVSVMFSGGGEEPFFESVVAYRHENQLRIVGANNVTLTFEIDELRPLLETSEIQGENNGQ